MASASELAGATTHGLSSNRMALITSDCDKSGGMASASELALFYQPLINAGRVGPVRPLPHFLLSCATHQSSLPILIAACRHRVDCNHCHAIHVMPFMSCHSSITIATTAHPAVPCRAMPLPRTLNLG